MSQGFAIRPRGPGGWWAQRIFLIVLGHSVHLIGILQLTLNLYKRTL